MITLSNVSKYYISGGECRVILHDVSYTIERNQRLGILADSKSGKTTIARMLAGVEAPDEGSINVGGSISWPLGFAGGFHPNLTGEENVRAIAALYGLDADPICTFCQEMSELGSKFYRPLHHYSSVMRASLGYALSMSMNFDAYLADETISVGNDAFRNKCEVMLRAKIEDSTFVFLGRNIRSLRRMCTSAAVLRDGMIIDCSDFDEAFYILNA